MSLRYLSKALSFMNMASMASNPIFISTQLLHALENLAKPYKKGERTGGETMAYAFLDLSTPEQQLLLIESIAFHTLLEFKPLIRSEDIAFYEYRLRDHNKPIHFDEFAVNTHVEFIESVKKSNPNHYIICQNLFRLIHLVRSNIAHSEKDETIRNRNVCEAINPLLELILKFMLQFPKHRLLTYGTLSPGESNAYRFETLNAKTSKVTVHGTIRSQDHYLSFTPSESDSMDKHTTVDVVLYESPRMPEFWDELDAYEGRDYKRILVPFIKGFQGIDGQTYGAAYIYASVEN